MWYTRRGEQKNALGETPHPTLEDGNLSIQESSGPKNSGIQKKKKRREGWKRWGGMEI